MLALMGFHVSPVGFLSPPHAAAGAFWCYTEPTASGESRRQLVIAFFSLFSVYRGWQVGPQRGANRGNIICGATVDFDSFSRGDYLFSPYNPLQQEHCNPSVLRHSFVSLWCCKSQKQPQPGPGAPIHVIRTHSRYDRAALAQIQSKRPAGSSAGGSAETALQSAVPSAGNVFACVSSGFALC